MFKKFATTLISSALILTPVLAEQVPVAFKEDARIKEYTYDENNVYKLSLFLKSVTAIQFASGESVQSIIIGDSSSWEVVKLKSGNVVSIKPIIEGALTNMTVYTDQHVYTFELRSVGEIQAGAKRGSAQAFRISFNYPDIEVEKDDREITGGPLNYNYQVSGHAQFKPVEVRDDSYRTFFVLPAGAPRPAIFKVGLDKKERLVNSRTDGGRIIVDGTSDFWVMRIGDETICVGRSSAIAANQRKIL